MASGREDHDELGEGGESDGGVYRPSLDVERRHCRSLEERVLCTINMGGTYLHPNVYESHVAAAVRWGAQYLQLLSPWGGTKRLWSMKARLHKAGFSERCRVCFIDGDAIIRHDCPDPFDIVPEHFFGAVQGHQLPENDPELTGRWWTALSDSHKARPKYVPEHYFNTGFMVFTPRLHGRLWELWPVQHYVMEADGPMLEQTALNWSVAALGAPVMLLPHTFNKLGPEAWKPGPMGSYVQHLARGPWVGEQTLNDALGDIDWRRSAIPEVTAMLEPDKGVAVGA